MGRSGTYRSGKIAIDCNISDITGKGYSAAAVDAPADLRAVGDTGK